VALAPDVPEEGEAELRRRLRGGRVEMRARLEGAPGRREEWFESEWRWWVAIRSSFWGGDCDLIGRYEIVSGLCGIECDDDDGITCNISSIVR
jgi:hypothetical protein